MKERTSPHHLSRCPKLGITALEQEVADLYLPLREEDDHQKVRDVSECPKPFAAFGSFRQRHGDAFEGSHIRTIEAPAKLESSVCSLKGGLSQSLAAECNARPLVDIAHPDKSSTESAECACSTSKPPYPLRKFSTRGKAFSTDLDREEAWERKKEQYLLDEEDDDCDEDEEYGADEGFYDALSEHASEGVSSSESDEGGAHNDNDKGTGKHIVGCDNLDGVSHGEELHIQDMHHSTRRTSRRTQSFRRKPFPRSSIKTMRTKSLTDEDLEELRGSIDLGFGFSYSERCNLRSTLPALELYYAINKNFVDAQTRSSPVSPLEGNALLRTNSAGSASSPSSENWRISSPGDHPSQVKTRLRHWAQAVACSVKQGY
ncbi:hypothetical protein GOP47_0026094 [Adiantum capillus-veneris]|uniref:Uncharacterized protein n=1 Tax=Adiantum capillus-veneris TaxID=13818 RepID=A0A9D4U2J5_ADICA|nr:hypothetical protein GOP47_0025639 [Adiantum capillus-veneris]KAI5059775.1 hypothetical protein GOP47_0026094 [Adiantum capillus-veneris]